MDDSGQRENKRQSTSPQDASSTEKPKRAFERLMYRQVPLWCLLLTALLGLGAAISLSAIVRHAALGYPRLKVLQGPAMALAATPGNLMRVLSPRDPFATWDAGGELAGGFLENPNDRFSDTGYLLLTPYDERTRTPYVQLVRLSDGKVLREYRPDIDALVREAQLRWTETSGERALPFQIYHPDLTDDGGLLFNGKSILVRVDACGRVRWIANGAHHSIERDAEGAIWSPTVLPTPSRKNVEPTYRDDAVTQFNSDGRARLTHPIARILEQNGLAGLYLGRPYYYDPFHLNDIEPVVSDGPFWRRGDVFLSLRHLSMIALYRPSTGRILWWQIGPWLNQHDVVILDDHRIAIFDNRSVEAMAHSQEVIGHNRELVYDFASNRMSSPWDVGFQQHRVATVTEGRGTPLDNGDLYVEDSNGGRVMRMQRDGSLRWRYVHVGADGQRYRLAWSRYLDPARYDNAVRAAQNARCQ
jgi:hypothetical protein